MFSITPWKKSQNSWTPRWAESRPRSNAGAETCGTPAPLQQPSRTANPEFRRFLELYVERFNRKDWESLRELISADAQLRVVDAFEGRLANAPYFSNYERLSVPWKLAVGELGGEPGVVSLRLSGDAWTPYSFVRLEVGEDRIVDYSHCPWVAKLAEHAVR